MTEWSPVQRVWLKHYEPYHYDMFPGYQHMLPGTVPHNSPMQQYVQEHQNMPVSQNMPASQCLPIQQNLPLSPDSMPPQYYFEQPNMPMSQNFSLPEEYPMMQHAQMQNYTTEQYLPIYQNVPMTQNSMTSSTLSSPEYMTDPVSVPLPDDIPLAQNVPLPEDVYMPQCVDPSSEFSISSTSGYNMLHSSPPPLSTAFMPPPQPVHPSRKQDNPREIRNKAEKQRRDKLNRSIADLASMVPPVVAASRKIDKTGVLRLTAHYLRAHEYVFGDSLAKVAKQQFKSSSLRAVLGLFNGFLLTVTYKGIIVVVSENVQQYLGYTELELLGHNILSITHEDDHEMLMKQLMPKKDFLGPNGELIVPDEPDGIMKITEALGREKRKFILRLKKLGQRSEPDQYIRCHVEGSFRKSDKACVGSNRCCQVVRRARARTENHCTSGNDVVFIGVVRPEAETFITEIGLESSRMEYRTRHSIDGEIIQCEQRIALVTGYMIHEVQGVNAMNFMHKDDVHWVIIALREMYDEHRLYGESCYRLMTKNGDFIYMRTRGRLDVVNDSRVVTSFVCTNTVVDEAEGKHLIKMMKKNFNTKTKKEGELLKLMDKEESDKKDLPVEHPRQLEKVILHLVTNLPSQGEDNVTNESFISGASTSRRLEIIPPKKERIVSAIEKIYSVMTFPKEHCQEELLAITEDEENAEHLDAPGTSHSSAKVTEVSSDDDSSLLKSEPDKISEQDNMYFDMMTQPIEPTQYNMMTALEVDDYFNVSLFFPEVNQPTIHTAVEFKCQKGEAHEVQKNETKNQVNQENLQVALPSSSNTSLKRPYECLERNIIKKKLSNMSKDSENDTYLDDDFSCLEALFDDEMLDKQIESTIHSLEQSIDPTFPDLLISNDVQEFLQEIEGGQNTNTARV